MPKVKTQAPRPSREKGQRSLDLPNYFLQRVLPPFSNPKALVDGNVWRNIIASQPVAELCRETIISNYIALDWKIEPKESDQRDELKDEIEYYTEFFQNTGKYEYETIVEWIGTDLLDIPFGAAAEVGRAGDNPDGRVLWLELLDAATLYPYPHDDWPVYQHLKEVNGMKPIFFPKYAINRVYYSPRTNIYMEGWGMPPPEKIYLALELLSRGDRYYANLLLDTPEAGLLDLGDMSEIAAKEWIKAFREMLGGIDPLKIPVLYEHNNDVNFIPFGKPPTDLMFDRITAKYASMVAAGYGISLSDIGIQTTTSGGDTLAGSIRDERKSRRTGFARFKKKMISFFNFMLPKTLEYKIIDMDDELSVALGRARLANATAASQYIDKGIFSAQEMRLQAIADGLISVSVPEKIPEDAVPMLPQGGSPERPSVLGKPIAPSQGGYGEVLPKGDVFSDDIHRVIGVSDVALRQMIRSVIQPMSIQTQEILEELDDGELQAWDDWYDEMLWGDDMEGLSELTMVTLSESKDRLITLMDKINPWWKLSISVDDVYKEFSDVMDKKVKIRSAEIGEDIQEIEYSENFKSKISKILDDCNEMLERGVINSIIAGTKKSLIDSELIAKSLDEQGILHDNKTVEYVRREIFSLGKRVIEKFASSLAQSINDILEEI